MFTIGIFTTHIPYVIFVVFYAYFLLFGVEKASAGELQSADSVLKIEVHHNTVFAAQKNTSKFSYRLFYLQKNTITLIDNFAKKRKKQFTEVTNFIWNFEFLTSLSNRPPPSKA